MCDHRWAIGESEQSTKTSISSEFLLKMILKDNSGDKNKLHLIPWEMDSSFHRIAKCGGRQGIFIG